MPFSLLPHGFIHKYLYTGRKETAFSCDVQENNQMTAEKRMREIAARHAPLVPPKNDIIRIGGLSPLGPAWKYYYSHDNIFVDDASFYEELCRLEMHAVTQLVVETPMEVRLRLWSYAAVDVWHEGALVCTLERPVYKPIQYRDFSISLQAGSNQLYLRSETLGVRDTRIAFGVQVLTHTDKVRVELPDEEQCEPYHRAAALLDSAKLCGNKLCLDAPLPKGSRLRYDLGICDFTKQDKRFIYQNAEGKKCIELRDIERFELQVPIQGAILHRSLERAELNRPVYPSVEQCDVRRDLWEKVAQIRSEMRSATDGFSLFTMLARKHLGQEADFDYEELKISLQQIDRRMDCADFLTTALIRLKKEYGIPENLRAEEKRVMLNFRYWMDEPGQDGMCFWSENHTLMFYQTAYFFGEDYADEIFIRSGKTGRQMRALAKMRIQEWFQDVCETGFDEFNSSVYTPLTLAAMLNIVDYAEPELSQMAKRACDQLLYTLVRHYFKGIIISPMGRVYRGIICPWAESIQALICYLFPEAPMAVHSSLSFFATTHYQIPADLRQIAQQMGDYHYSSSNACIDLYKTADYIITSVQSPRRDGKTRVWQRETREEMRDHFQYVKSLNEHFHGTTEFQPGEYGYQQHMWYVGLNTDCVIFGNHPGCSCEDMSEVRPGYWYGNGRMPALRQEKNVLGMVYVIPESDPIHFTHLFWQQSRFDAQDKRGQWLMGCCAESYVGVWCSGVMENHDEVMFGCEKRVYASKCAYLVVCGSKTEDGSFEVFCDACQARSVSFDEQKMILHCSEFSLPFVEGCSGTQVLE